LFLLFFGLPGLGKTTFWLELKKIRKQTNIFIDYLSEDKIWEKLMIKQRRKTPSLSDGDLFLKIKEEGNKQYWAQLKHKMEFLGTVEKENLIFFLDKIIYPNTLNEIIKMLKKFCPSNINLRFSAVLPII